MIFKNRKNNNSTFGFDRAPLMRRLPIVLMLLVAAATVGRVSAQTQGTQVLDPSALKAPAGARVAIVEFYDLECPACAHANPTIKAAVAKYKIPWVRHDFLIPNHVWSPTAALTARWFDVKSKALGDEYRDQVFVNQRSIYNLDTLRDFTNKFAQSHGVQMPFSIDPQGTLAAAMKADNDIGIRTGIHGTPGIFVVIANSKGAPYIEVGDVDKKLYEAIDQAFTMAAGPAAGAAGKKPAK
jgi:protein-disulfide isomerase